MTWKPAVHHEPAKITPKMGGMCWLYVFPNGYTASVINDGYGKEYGEFELALGVRDESVELGWVTPPVGACESIPGMDSYGVRGWLDVEALDAILAMVRALPKRA